MLYLRLLVVPDCRPPAWVDENEEVEMSKNEDKKELSLNDPKYRGKYQKSKSGSGKSSVNNGDAVALALAGLTLEQVYNAATAVLGAEAVTAKRKVYENPVEGKRDKPLNLGMQRMGLGNMIRSATKNEETGKEAIANLNKVVAPFQKENAAAAKIAADAKAKATAEKAAKAKAAKEAKDKAAKKAA